MGICLVNSKSSQVISQAYCSGLLVPGGFGERGTLGKILACQYARINKMPFLGICLGLQVAVIEFCRNVLDMKNANSEEFDPKSPYPVVVFMPEISKTQMGGTMRLGLRATKFVKSGSISRNQQSKNRKTIWESRRYSRKTSTSLRSQY